MATEVCPSCLGNKVVGDLSLRRQCYRCFGRGYVEVDGKPRRKVICTELVRQRRLDGALYHACHRYAERHWSRATFDGYHCWAVPFVGIMRRSPVLSRIVAFFAVRRARHIARRLGDSSAGSLLGRIVAYCVDGGSTVLGRFCGGRDYLRLYDAQPATAPVVSRAGVCSRPVPETLRARR